MKFANTSRQLIKYLRTENPEIAKAVEGFVQLDKVAQQLGLIDEQSSFSNTITWLPVVAVLGTFSAGKSTFLNTYLNDTIQRTGNQAVDDKFSVIMHTTNEETYALPGTALDSDPRFPMFRIKEALGDINPGEGERVNAYLQLKTTHSPRAKGKIFIDSPGYDADDERDSILRIANHVIDIADLVLVFFDARHPEPGAMRNTLEKLVGHTIQRPDADKCLYILNQIDATANEDNPEEVFAAWQRGIASAGLKRGRFFRIFDSQAAAPILDDAVRERFENKRDEDLAEIHKRIDQVTVDRAYRIAARLEQSTVRVRDHMMPAVAGGVSRYMRRVRYFDWAVGAAGVIGGGGWYLQEGLSLGQGRAAWIIAHPVMATVAFVTIAGALLFLRAGWVRYFATRALQHVEPGDLTESERTMVERALGQNRGLVRSLFATDRPKRWTAVKRRKLSELVDRADQIRQALNNRFAQVLDPSQRNSDS